MSGTSNDCLEEIVHARLVWPPAVPAKKTTSPDPRSQRSSVVLDATETTACHHAAVNGAGAFLTPGLVADAIGVAANKAATTAPTTKLVIRLLCKSRLRITVLPSLSPA
jgi:hypothetical protein